MLSPWILEHKKLREAIFHVVPQLGKTYKKMGKTGNFW
jgi:hypothetical protein